jgi:hypothetical protein
MGTVREYGYREYEDHLTPGSGGESSLLFDEGHLAGHARFHTVDGAEGSDASGPSEGENADDPRLGALILGGAAVAAIAWGATEISKRAVRAIRARRDANESSDEPSGADEVQEAEVASDTAQDAAFDEDDQLIEEVGALGAEALSAMETYKRSAQAGKPDQSHSSEEPAVSSEPRKRTQS